MLASSSFHEDFFVTLSNNYCMHQSLLLGDTYFAFMYGILYVWYRRDQSAVIVTFVFSEMVAVRFPEHMSRRRGRSGSRVCPLSVVFLPAPGRRCLVSGSGDESGPRAVCIFAETDRVSSAGIEADGVCLAFGDDNEGTRPPHFGMCGRSTR